MVLAVLTVVFSPFAADVYACQCLEREPPCAQYGSADVVFIGLVLKITQSDRNFFTTIDFSIERAVKGLNGTTAQLVSYGTSFDAEFAEGKTYLVYAYRNSKRNELYTHYCTRTRELSKASADLAFLNLPSEKRQSPRILGVLAEDGKSLRGIRIVASSGG